MDQFVALNHHSKNKQKRLIFGMMDTPQVAAYPANISAIVPTIGRPESLARLLASLAAQTVRMHEVIVADASGGEQIKLVAGNSCWKGAGLDVHRIVVSPPNAVKQRNEAIHFSTGKFLLLLDDDVVLEPKCVRCMLDLIESDPTVVGVSADFNNQRWPQPALLWRLYLRLALGLEEGSWQGRIVGPLLRFGFDPPPATPQEMEWLGTGNSLVLRSAFFEAGGFSDFFLKRSTVNEDVDFGIKLSRVGKIVFCPVARMAHNHDPLGRVSIAEAAEDDLHNRFFVLHRTMEKSCLNALGLVLLFYFGETLSNLLGCLRRGRGGIAFFQRLCGRSRALGILMLGALRGFEHRKPRLTMKN
jgi:GT2 family glycosyltransferase